jgi:DnaK suppressor protein
MNELEKIEKALKERLSELRTHVAKVDRELHKLLPADSEEQAIELENQEALEVVGKTETTEIRQIEAALNVITHRRYRPPSGPCGWQKPTLRPQSLPCRAATRTMTWARRMAQKSGLSALGISETDASKAMLFSAQIVSSIGPVRVR